MLSSIIYLGLIFLMDRRNKQSFKVWDKMTVTISNYTIKYEIPKAVCKGFDNIRNSMNYDHKETSLMSFKEYLKYEFEQILSNQKAIESNDDFQIIIFHIHLSLIMEACMAFWRREESRLKILGKKSLQSESPIQ
jgi:hypothetical protein